MSVGYFQSVIDETGELQMSPITGVIFSCGSTKWNSSGSNSIRRRHQVQQPPEQTNVRAYLIRRNISFVAALPIE